jgi:hypothetical protein
MKISSVIIIVLISLLLITLISPAQDPPFFGTADKAQTSEQAFPSSSACSCEDDEVPNTLIAIPVPMEPPI